MRDRLTREAPWLAALAASAVAAWIAAQLLAPDPGQLIAPVKTTAQAEFSPEQIARGRDFRRPQLWLALGALGAQVALLLRFSVRPPARWLNLRRVHVGAMMVGGLISVGLAAMQLPFAVVGRLRAIDVGLSSDSWLSWARDQVVAAALGAVMAAVLALIVLALVRRLPRGWWLPGGGVVVIAAAAVVFAGPVVLDPLFNRFRPLERSALRADVEALARAADVRIDEIYVTDASRRTTAANAYVAGLGSTKRLVVYDTVVEDFAPAQVRSIVAHELGHQRYSDLPRGLLYVALVAPLGLWAVGRLARRVSAQPLGVPAAVPALALGLVVVSSAVTWISNDLSRAVEARADAFALRATGEPRAFIALQKRLTIQNVGDPEPPQITRALFSTHPNALERIGMARAVLERR